VIGPVVRARAAVVRRSSKSLHDAVHRDAVPAREWQGKVEVVADLHSGVTDEERPARAQIPGHGGGPPAARLPRGRIDVAVADRQVDRVADVAPTLNPLYRGRSDDREDARPAIAERPLRTTTGRAKRRRCGPPSADRLVGPQHLKASIGRGEAEPELSLADPDDHRSKRDRATVDVGLDERAILDRKLAIGAAALDHRGSPLRIVRVVTPEPEAQARPAL